MADKRLEPLLARFPSLSHEDIAATFKRVTHELASARRGGAGSDDWQCASLANRALGLPPCFAALRPPPAACCRRASPCSDAA